MAFFLRVDPANTSMEGTKDEKLKTTEKSRIKKGKGGERDAYREEEF